MKRDVDGHMQRGLEAYREVTEGDDEPVRVDAVYGRIAGSLSADAEQPRWRVWLVLPAAAALATVLVVVSYGLSHHDAATPAMAQVLVERGDVIVLADDVRVADGAHAELILAGDVETAMQGPARLALLGGQPVVLTGRARFSVRSRAGREPYRMRAGDADILVRGTDFEVRVDGETLTYLGVREGVVEVQRGGAMQSITAGASIGEQPQTPIAMEHLPAWHKTGEAAHVEPVQASRVDAASQSVLPRAPEPRGKRTPDAAELMERLRKARAAGQCAKVEDLAEQLAHSEVNGAALLELAECHVQSGAPRSALDVYRRIVSDRSRTSNAAETALLEQARILSELGEGKKALSVIEDYLAHYAKGRFIAQASFRRCELLIDLTRFDEARACLESFRATFAKDGRVSNAMFLSATLSRTQGRWQEAANTYREYLGRNDTARREEAMYQLAKSLFSGKLPGAEEAVSAYLSAYPNGRFAEELRQRLRQ